ncbi:MAG: cysteine--tRNA ligase [bacterium]
MAWFSFFSPAKDTNTRSPQEANIFFTNTLSGKKERFVPLKPGTASLYSCGPTVYGPQHIGNLRAAVFADTIGRTLLFAGYHVRRVINITDVGHLVDDADLGEDKMSVGARRDRVSPAEVAERYTKRYLGDIRALNVDTGHIFFPRATEYIKEQIAMIQTLEQKGLVYRLADGAYFDTEKFSRYGALGNIMAVELREGARVKAVAGKKNPHDFVLWRSATARDLQQWDSPWGRGNPGWSIECSAMSRALLGIEIDVHSGGIEHIPVHHNNEIAQSEGASGRTFVRYWLHNAHLMIAGEKISKSLGNTYLLSDVTERGYPPLALRYFFHQAHYRTQLSFSWEALAGAAEALGRLGRIAREVAEESKGKTEKSEARDRFVAAMYDDLATPQALGILWETLRDDDYSAEEKWGLLKDADALLGLRAAEAADLPPAELPEEVRELLSGRDEARKAKDFERADELRTELENRGYRVDDGPEGTLLTKRPE